MTRPLVFVVAVAAVITLGVTATPGFVLSRDPVANLPARFDAGWYGGIALDGYNWDHTFQRQRNIAFFPALPLLMRPVGAVLGMYEDGPSPETEDVARTVGRGRDLISCVPLGALLRVTRGRRSDRPRACACGGASAGRVSIRRCTSTRPYTESLFLLGAAGACSHFLRRDWVAASLWGVLAGLSRPNGCFLCVPLAILAAQGSDRRSTIRDVWARLVVAAMPAVGMMCLHALPVSVDRRGLVCVGAQPRGVGPVFPGPRAVDVIRQRLGDAPFLQLITNNPYNAINAAGVLFAVVMTYPVFRTLGLAWGMFVVVNLLPPLAAGGLLSMGRLTSTLFPLFLALAAVVPPRADPGMDRRLHDRTMFLRRAVFYLAPALLGSVRPSRCRPLPVRARLTVIDLAGSRIPL